jgi:hypothetical protein
MTLFLKQLWAALSDEKCRVSPAFAAFCAFRRANPWFDGARVWALLRSPWGRAIRV